MVRRSRRASASLQDLDDLAVALLARLRRRCRSRGTRPAGSRGRRRSSRPPLSMSSMAASSARRSGWWNGSTTTAVPIRMRLVVSARRCGHQQRAAEDAVPREVVLGEPDRVETELVGQLDLLERLEEHRVIGRPVRREQVLHAELHRRTSSSTTNGQYQPFGMNIAIDGLPVKPLTGRLVSSTLTSLPVGMYPGGPDGTDDDNRRRARRRQRPRTRWSIRPPERRLRTCRPARSSSSTRPSTRPPRRSRSGAPTRTHGSRLLAMLADRRSPPPPTRLSICSSPRSGKPLVLAELEVTASRDPGWTTPPSLEVPRTLLGRRRPGPHRDAPPPARRRRRDPPVELPDGDDDHQARRRAARRQHGGGQAVTVHAVRRAPAGRDHQRGAAPRRRQRGQRRQRARRSDDEPSDAAQGHLHRFDRQPGSRWLRRRRQRSQAGRRSSSAATTPRSSSTTSTSRPTVAGAAGARVVQRRPDLRDPEADLRSGPDLRRGRRRLHRAAERYGSGRRADARRWGPCRPSRSTTGSASWWPTPSPRASPRRPAAARSTARASGSSRRSSPARATRHPPRRRGAVRPGAADPALRDRSTRRSASANDTMYRSLRLGLGRRTSSAPTEIAERLECGVTLRQLPRRPPSERAAARLEVERHRDGARHRGDARVHRAPGRLPGPPAHRHRPHVAGRRDERSPSEHAAVPRRIRPGGDAGGPGRQRPGAVRRARLRRARR